MPYVINLGAYSKVNRKMKIGRLATKAGVSTDTLRYYEKRKLLISDRRPNGYRDFPDTMVERVRLIRLAQSLGFSLREIKDILTRLGDDLPAEDIVGLLTEKLEQVEARIAALKELQALLMRKLAEARSAGGR